MRQIDKDGKHNKANDTKQYDNDVFVVRYVNSKMLEITQALYKDIKNLYTSRWILSM